MTVIRGGGAGWAQTGSSSFSRTWSSVPGVRVPGEGFGWTLGVYRLPGDARPDLVVTARAPRRLDDAILLLEAGPGAFAPDETRVSRVRLADTVRAPRIDLIRLGRG